MSVSERRIYRFLTALLPNDFRARNSAAMEDLLAEALAESRGRGRWAQLGTWFRGSLDILRYAAKSFAPSRRSAGSGHRGGVADRSGRGAGPSRPTRLSSGGLTGILEDVRYAIRRLTRAPLVTGVAIAVAGIGIGASTATFSVLDAVLLRPLPYPEADRLVQITQKTTPEGVALGRPLREDLSINAQDFLVYEAETSSFSNWAWTFEYESDRDATVGGGEGAPQGVEVMGVSPSFFSTLGAVLPLGRTSSQRACATQRIGTQRTLAGSPVERGRDHQPQPVVEPFRLRSKSADWSDSVSVGSSQAANTKASNGRTLRSFVPTANGLKVGNTVHFIIGAPSIMSVEGKMRSSGFRFNTSNYIVSDRRLRREWPLQVGDGLSRSMTWRSFFRSSTGLRARSANLL